MYKITTSYRNKKWLASVSGIFSSSAIVANAATLVQIDFIGNQITAGGGNQLFSDIDFDGNSDFTIYYPFFFSGNNTRQAGFYDNQAAYYSGNPNVGGVFSLNAVGSVLGLGRVYGNLINGEGTQGFYSQGATATTSQGFRSVTLNSTTLGLHQGFIQIETNSSPFNGDAGVSITRFLFDPDNETTSITDVESLGANGIVPTVGITTATSFTPITVPEPSSLMLLAAGAGGVLIRRRRKQVA